MSDTTATTEVTEKTEKPEEAKGLRKQLNDAHAVIAKQRTDILTPAYEQLGLDPSKELGKAIAKEYEGEASFDALAKFAKEEYGYEHTPADPSHPQAAEIAQGQAALDQIGQTAGSVVAPNEGDVLAKAEADGDYATTMAIKGQRVADQLLRR